MLVQLFKSQISAWPNQREKEPAQKPEMDTNERELASIRVHSRFENWRTSRVLQSPLGFRILTPILACIAALYSDAAETSHSAPPASDHYAFRQQHDPDGIGKFYMGREIAHVMGHQGADWLERPEREEEEHTTELVTQLRLHSGDVVADIGAGTGYLSRRLAKAVGPTGKVLAEDIQPQMLELLTNKMAELHIANVVPVLGSVTNAGLTPGSVDLAVMADVYHEFDFPYEMMQAICRSLKPGGRVVFVEFRAEDPNVPIKPVHKMTEAQVKKEMSMMPLQWVQTISVLPRQHIIIFRKTL
jgi:ubiquinone/menaquinone biosynthesis C-methylase UbiE